MWHVASFWLRMFYYKVCLEILNSRTHLGDSLGQCKSECLKETEWENWIIYVILVIRVGVSSSLYRNLQHITQTNLLVY
jgi:hypothetical protein